MALYQSLDRELAVYGSYQSGKTYPCLDKIRQLHLLWPGFQSLILRQEKADVVKTVIPKWENEILPIHPQHRASPVKVRGKNSPQWYDWPNGGRTWIDGCNNPKDFETGAWDLIYVCQGEEITLDTFEILAARANGRAGNWNVNGRPVGQVIIDMNPDRRDHWSEERIESGQMRRLHFTFDDNPTLHYNGEDTAWGRQVKEDLAKTLSGSDMCVTIWDNPPTQRGPFLTNLITTRWLLTAYPMEWRLGPFIEVSTLVWTTPLSARGGQRNRKAAYGYVSRNTDGVNGSLRTTRGKSVGYPPP